MGYICSRCFKQRCYCGVYKIEIDDDIVEAISTLNKKGYITDYCCSGHIDSPIIYIKFSQRINLDIIPYTIGRFWKYVPSTKVLSYTCRGDINNLKNELLEKQAELKKWVDSLPILDKDGI